MSEHLLGKVGDEVPLEIHEHARAAGVWEFLGETFFIDEEIDPSIVKGIRVFDPNYVPLRCQRRYRTPANTVVKRDYHVVGRYIENPTEPFKDEAVSLHSVPRGFKFPPDKIHALRTLWAPWPGPHIDEAGIQQPPSREWLLGIPPARVDPGPWLVEQLHAVHKFFDVGVELTSKDSTLVQSGNTSHTVDKLQQILDAENERDQKLQREAMSEARYRMRHNWRQFMEAADKERWAPEPPDAAPKPYVFMKG